MASDARAKDLVKRLEKRIDSPEFSKSIAKIIKQQNTFYSLSKVKGLLDKFIIKLGEIECIDDESILYFPQNYDFKANDPSEVFRYFEHKYNDKIIDAHDVFPIYRINVLYKGVKLQLRLIIGQGSCVQIYKERFSKKDSYVEVV